MSEELKKKKVNPRRLQGTTNFYPTYVDGNKDKVTPVGAARRTDFQTVLPRYSLSMTETRNEGTGPNFLEIEYEVPAYRRNAEPKKTEVYDQEEEPLFKLPVINVVKSVSISGARLSLSLHESIIKF
ncbi:MAG: hypothetical protein ACJ0DI_15060 [bacterium]